MRSKTTERRRKVYKFQRCTVFLSICSKQLDYELEISIATLSTFYNRIESK